MRIWHPQLIPLLCQKHLCAMWRESLGAYTIITQNKQGYRNHPATQEYINAPGHLYVILTIVRAEMLARNYHPKPLPSPVALPNEQLRPWQSLSEQI